MTRKCKAGFIVVWDHNDGFVSPMGFNPDCDGALECMTEKAAWFSTRQKARAAIKVSEAKARLDATQGKPVNEDWLPKNRKFIRIVELEGEV